MAAQPGKQPAIVVAARALVIHRGHVLLLHAREPGREYYFLPGGGVRHSETLREACLREVLEETELEVRVVRSLGLREFIASRHKRRPAGMPEQQHAMAVIFLCQLATAQADAPLDQLGRFTRDQGAETVQGLCWKPLSQIANLELHPPQLQHLLAQDLFSAAFEFWPEE
ncbi:MAG: NUDIX domain-containing protein [Planctomycetes bacterium]|nr:NUDIX domain-containing protein [Planctomycetota bacterium]